MSRGLFSTDHKLIARQYLFTCLGFFLLGGLLAMAMRWQLAWPGAEVPLLGRIAPALKAQAGVMPPETYAEFFSQHGTIMIFFVVIPMLVGAFGSFLVPLQIGAREMAFPGLNATAFRLFLVGGIVNVASFFVPGGAGASGWTAYPPLSLTTLRGQDLWIISLLFVGVSFIMGAVCQLVTILNMRAPGMTLMRMPLPTWSFLVTAVITVLATPALVAALLLLFLDRHAGTSFFSPSELVIDGELRRTAADGQPILWQHLFWFYAHPAVYIMILPAMGMISEMLSVFSRKPIFGYRAFVASTIAIASLGFVVWGHHMFQSGMNPYLGTTFMISTMAIAVPSGVKTFNWILTLWRGSITLTVPMLNALAFVSMFVIGGLSGIFAASTPVDIYIHDTYFIVAHIHYVLFGGSIFAIFGAMTYWFPKIFGRTMNPAVGTLHFLFTFVAYNGTFFPMHILGVGGMMRRVYDPTVFAHLQHLQPLNVFMTLSAYLLGISQLLFILNFFCSRFSLNGIIVKIAAIIAAIACGLAAAPLMDMVLVGLGIDAFPFRFARMNLHVPGAFAGLLISAAGAIYLLKSDLRFGAPAEDNPWQANTLEWQTASPPPHNNFPRQPRVYRGAYEYSSPERVDADYIPQDYVEVKV